MPNSSCNGIRRMRKLKFKLFASAQTGMHCTGFRCGTSPVVKLQKVFLLCSALGTVPWPSNRSTEFPPWLIRAGFQVGDAARTAWVEHYATASVSMGFLGDDGGEALSILGDNDVIWRHVSSADLVQPVAKEQRVRVWGVVKNGNASVVKFSTRERTEEALEQITSEMKAAMLLSKHLPHPLLVHPVKTIIDPDVGSFSISPYAGASAAEMRKQVWVNLEVPEYEKHCQTFAASILLTQRLFYGSAADDRQRFLHKDIKLENSCYNRQHDFFTLIDYGAYSSVDKSVWVDCIDDRYLDCQMAKYLPKFDQYAAESDDGVQATISATTDIYQTGLAVVELFLGHLPAEIDMSRYGDDRRAYYNAVWNFRWADCKELSTMPALMKEWVLKALAFNPGDRFQSASEAFGHPWLQVARLPVIRAVNKAAPGWTQLVESLKQDLKADTSSRAASVVASVADDGCALSSSAGVSTPSTGSNATDQAAYTQSQAYDDSEEYDDESDSQCGDEEYAEYQQQDGEQHSPDGYGTHSEDCSTLSDSLNRRSCWDAEEADACHSSSPPAAPLAARRQIPLAYLRSSDYSSSCIAAVEQDSTNEALSTTSSKAEAGVNSAVTSCDNTPGAAAPTCLYNRCSSGVANIDSQFSLYQYAGLAYGSNMSSSGTSYAAAAAAVAWPSALAAQGSSTSSGPGTDNTQWLHDELDDCCDILAAPTAAAAELVTGRFLDLASSACDGPSSNSKAADAAPDLGSGPAHEVDGYCRVVPAGDQNVYKHLQSLMVGSFNCLSADDSSCTPHSDFADDHNTWEGIGSCSTSADGSRAVSARSAAAHSMPAFPPYAAVGCGSCLGPRSKVTSCCDSGILSSSSNSIRCGSAPAASINDLQLGVCQSQSGCNSDSTSSQRSSSNFSNSSSGADCRSKSSVVTAVSDTPEQHQEHPLELELVSAGGDVLQMQRGLELVQTLPQLMTTTVAGVLQQDANCYPTTADKGIQVDWTEQYQCEQQSHPSAQGFSDYHQQQQSDDVVCCETSGVPTASSHSCSRQAGAVGPNRKARKHLKFAAGVLVTLLVGWKHSGHR